MMMRRRNSRLLEGVHGAAESGFSIWVNKDQGEPWRSQGGASLRRDRYLVEHLAEFIDRGAIDAAVRVQF